MGSISLLLTHLGETWVSYYTAVLLWMNERMRRDCLWPFLLV